MTIRTTRRAGASTRLALKPSAAPIPLSTVATGQGSFAGYASLFGVADSQGDTVQPGRLCQGRSPRAAPPASPCFTSTTSPAPSAPGRGLLKTRKAYGSKAV